MAGMSDMIVIVLVLGVGYWLYSSGQLDQILGSFQNASGGSGNGNEMTNAQTGSSDTNYESDGSSDFDVEGENSGAVVNGECHGDPEQCRKAMNLLNKIM